MVNDVTEQRVAERALKESEARFRRIANSAPAMMWVTRLDRVRDFVNDAYVEFVGGPGRPRGGADDRLATRIHPDDVDRILAESVAGEASGRAVHAGGALPALRRRVALAAHRSRSRASGPTASWSASSGLRATSRSPRKRSSSFGARSTSRRASWRFSEARFRAVFDTVLEVLVLMEPDGTVVELNRKEAPWRAENAREAVGRKIWDAPTLRMYRAARRR